jgi:hypothetical protein
MEKAMTEPTSPETPAPKARRRPAQPPRRKAVASKPRRERRASGPPPREALLGELRALEVTLGEVLDRVGERLRTRLAAISAAVGGSSGSEIPAKKVDAMRSAIRALDVRPVKARVKDVLRLRDLLEDLHGQLSGGS